MAEAPEHSKSEQPKPPSAEGPLEGAATSPEPLSGAGDGDTEQAIPNPEVPEGTPAGEKETGGTDSEADVLDEEDRRHLKAMEKRARADIDKRMETYRSDLLKNTHEALTADFANLFLPILEAHTIFLDRARESLLSFVRMVLKAGQQEIPPAPEMALVGLSALNMVRAFCMPPLSSSGGIFSTSEKSPNVHEASLGFLSLFKDLLCMGKELAQKARKVAFKQLEDSQLEIADLRLQCSDKNHDVRWTNVVVGFKLYYMTVLLTACTCEFLGIGSTFPRPKGMKYKAESVEAVLLEKTTPRPTGLLKKQMKQLQSKLKEGQDGYGYLQEKLTETEAGLGQQEEAAKLMRRVIKQAEPLLNNSPPERTLDLTPAPPAPVPEPPKKPLTNKIKKSTGDQILSTVENLWRRLANDKSIQLLEVVFSKNFREAAASLTSWQNECYNSVAVIQQGMLEDTTLTSSVLRIKAGKPVPTPPMPEAAYTPEVEATASAKVARIYRKRASLAKINADLQSRKQQEEREKAALRKEVGLATEVEEDTVVAKCTAFRGLNGASCFHEHQGSNIQGMEKYVVLTCTDECKMFFHQDCWKLVEKLHREAHVDWRLKRGVACLTEGCPGTISYCALQQGLPREPQEVQVLVHPEEKQITGTEGKQRHSKPKKKHSEKGHEGKHKVKHGTEGAESADARDPSQGPVSVQTPQDEPAAPVPIPPGSPPKPAIDISLLDLEALKPVERIDFSVSPKKKQEKVKAHKQKQLIHPEIVLQVGQGNHHQAPQPLGERPRPPRPASSFFEELGQVLPSMAPSNPPVTQTIRRVTPAWQPPGGRFSVEAGESQGSSRRGVGAADQAQEIPRLDEAAIAASDPEFFTFAQQVLQVINDLKSAHPSQQSVSLVLEELDIDSWIEEGVVPEEHLRDVLSAFGQVDQLHLFFFLSTAAVRFNSSDHAAQAKEAMDGSTIGRLEVKVSYLILFPSEILFKTRLGADVWAKYNSPDIQMALRTAWRTEQREQKVAEEAAKAATGGRQAAESSSRPASGLSQSRWSGTLNPAAKPYVQVSGSTVPAKSGAASVNKGVNSLLSHDESFLVPGQASIGKKKLHLNASATEFVPSNFVNSSGSPLPLPKAESALPEKLREFQRVEVLACDSHSIGLYLEQKVAFGVMPNQVMNMGFDANISTALVPYQMDTAELYGLWKVNGREINNGVHVIVVNLVEEFEPLPEDDWWSLLEYDESANCYTYPQCLDLPCTQELLKVFSSHKKKRSIAQLLPRPLKLAPPVNGIVEKDQKESRRKIEQPMTDEEVAKKLQDELNFSPPSVHSAEVFAGLESPKRLQEEEQHKDQPPAPAAVVQPAPLGRQPKPIPAQQGRLSSSSSDSSSPTANNFSAFFPMAAAPEESAGRPQPEADSSPEATDGPEEDWWNTYENVGLDDSSWCDDPVGWEAEVGGMAKNAAKDVESQLAALSDMVIQGDLSFGTSVSEEETSMDKQTVDRNKFGMNETGKKLNASQSPAVGFDDFLSLLGIKQS